MPRSIAGETRGDARYAIEPLVQFRVITIGNTQILREWIADFARVSTITGKHHVRERGFEPCSTCSFEINQLVVL